jgi:DNA-cytosine methyltransferase
VLVTRLFYSMKTKIKIENVLSLYDGMGCLALAMRKAGIKYKNYFASEIDRHAITVSSANFPDHIQVGTVTEVTARSLADALYTNEIPRIDFIAGGSPCTDLSFSGTRTGLQANSLKEYLAKKKAGYKFHGQSYLFWEFVRLVRELKPKYFLLENTPMKKEHMAIITRELGVEPVMIDSADFSAQNRKRYYWANFEIDTWYEVKTITVKDILEKTPPVRRWFQDSTIKNTIRKLKGFTVDGKKALLSKFIKTPALKGVEVFTFSSSGRGDKTVKARVKTGITKAMTLTAHEDSTRSFTGIKDKKGVRLLTIVERERLQTVPDNFTAHVSETQRAKMLGNGWTIDVIAHILGGMK